jgi:subtilisin
MSKRFLSGARRGAALSLVVGAVACNDVPHPTAAPYVPPPEFSAVPGIENLADVPAVTIDTPREPQRWTVSAEALEFALEEGDWHGYVGFKAAASPRVTVDGSGRSLRHAVSADAIEEGLRLLASHDVELVYYNGLIGGSHVIFPPGVASDLRDHALIDFIDPNSWSSGRGAATVVRPAEDCCELPSQVTPIGAQLVRAPQTWTYATGDGVRVGFIDDGYDVGHEDLYNIGSGHCWDGDSNDCPSGGGWHGTLVAGVAVGRNNSVGVVGVAPGVLDDAYWCSDYGTAGRADCIGKMAQSPWSVQIINMSWWESDDYTSISTAVSQAFDNYGRLLISIANNRDSASTPTPPSTVYPASYEDVIGVSGVMPDSSFASGPQGICVHGSPPDTLYAGWGDASNYGDYVELSAPFYTITTAPDGSDHDYLYVCGTSFAAPHVAGVAALIWEDSTSWSNDQVRQHLQNTAHDLGGSGWDQFYGYGLVDAYAAVASPPPPPPPPPPPTVQIQGPSQIPPTAAEECAWNASVTGANGSVT